MKREGALFYLLFIFLALFFFFFFLKREVADISRGNVNKRVIYDGKRKMVARGVFGEIRIADDRRTSRIGEKNAPFCV